MALYTAMPLYIKILLHTHNDLKNNMTSPAINLEDSYGKRRYWSSTIQDVLWSECSGARQDSNLRSLDYEIASPWWEPHGLAGCKPIINLTLTSFVTSRNLIRSGILISGGIGKSARFNQVFWTKLLPI